MKKIINFFKIKYLTSIERGVILDKIVAYFDGDNEKYRINYIAARVLRFKIYRLKHGL